MERRQFIYLTAMGTTAIGISAIGCRHRRSDSHDVLEKPEQLAQICDVKTLKEIGKAYRVQVEPDIAADKLEGFLLTDSAGHPVSSASDAAFVQSLMSKKTNRDFETGNIVIVKGWVLALTEARQCALLFVNNP